MLLTLKDCLNLNTIISIFYMNFLEIVILTLLLFNFWNLFSSLFFRKKFIYFLGFLFSLSVLGFYYSWDGWLCIMILAELLIVLLFLLVWINFKFAQDAQFPLVIFKYFFFSSNLLIYFVNLNKDYAAFLYNYQVLYWFKSSTISSDFHTMFKFFFLDYPLTVIFLTLILSLISIFFIGFYYTLKKLQNQTKKKKKLLHILRKQQMTKQALFKSQIKMFQLK